VSPDGGPAPAYLVRGDDPTLLGDGVAELVAQLVRDADPSLVVEDFMGEDYDVATVADAARTPPFLAERRVIVARGVGRFTTEDVAPLLACLADPLPTSTLVFVGGGGQVPRALVDAVKKIGEIVDAAAPTGRKRTAWVARRIDEHDVRLDSGAVGVLTEHLGDDLGRLASVLDILLAAYGAERRLGVDEVRPFLGEAGSVAPWDLTDSIDRGDVAGSLEQLRRITSAGGRHPLEIMATLHNHYRRMLRLDGAGIETEADAAAALGLTGSTFPAKKALGQTRRIGHDGVARAITLLSDADLALKGEIDWPGDLVLEVLVARLARLAPRPARSVR
jgi:DNA polymerase-3 subunit delta